MWVIALLGGLFGLLQCSGVVRLDERYWYLAFHTALVIGGAIFAPWYWGLAAVLAAGTILYFAERWYARQWGYPRLWWYKFFQNADTR